MEVSTALLKPPQGHVRAEPMPLRYCPSCQRMVPVKKRFSWPAFVAWLVIGWGLGVLVYLIYYAFKPTDACTTCEAKTLTAPPPGYVLNPNATAMYVPQELVHHQQLLHQQRDLFAQAPPPAEMLGTRPHSASTSPAGVLPASAGESWSNVTRPDRTACPGCRHVFAVEARRPLDVQCPSCGTRGTLSGPAAAPLPQEGASW